MLHNDVPVITDNNSALHNDVPGITNDITDLHNDVPVTTDDIGKLHNDVPVVNNVPVITGNVYTYVPVAPVYPTPKNEKIIFWSIFYSLSEIMSVGFSAALYDYINQL